MRDRTDSGVGLGAAQRFRIHHLPCRPFDEIRTTQTNERGAFHHEDDVRQRRQIRAARNAGTHHGGDLRHLEIAPHDRVVVEDPGRTILTREDASLIRQVHARRVDQIDDRDALAHRDLLRAQDLADRLRPPRPRFDRRVIRDDHPGAPTDTAQSSAAHSWMYLMRSDVGVPGPKSLPVPCDSSALMSWGGIMPPPVSSTSCRPAASSSLRTRGKSVMCAPERIDKPTTSTSSWIAAWAIISGV